MMLEIELSIPLSRMLPHPRMPVARIFLLSIGNRDTPIRNDTVDGRNPAPEMYETLKIL